MPATGRIKGAVNLPPGALYNADGTYKSKAEIEAMAKPVVGADLNKEIIVYCDTGKVCYELVAGPLRPAGLQEREGLRRLLHGVDGGPRDTQRALSL